MKNIHIIQTDKPSRLSILNNGKLNFGAEFISSSNSKAQNIYITSNEEIKEGDWYYDLDTKYVKIKQSWENSHLEFNAKKIILTTDQDLIKDGVQVIDDEFLEWFVKNPSCESVEVEKMFNVVQFTSREYIYKIIIPKEEPKQETLEEFAKQEAIKQYSEDTFGNFIVRKSIEKGAKWQAERMYSEESECVNLYLDDLNIPRKSQDDKEYSIVGRIKQLEKRYLKEMSEVENYYMQQFKNK